jgi:transketolase
MRSVFCQALVSRSGRRDFVFLTGDLGYRALEPLRTVLGPRFINAGVAEQNMVSVAAGLSRNGMRPWAYSIAPFLFARPFEQIRNDVCLHNLPVVLVGNGGGYGYGVMGATHHALEDYGILLTLPGMRVTIPAFDADVDSAVASLFETDHPAYLRLGLSEEPAGWIPPPFAPWRKLVDGSGPTIVAVGPLAGSLWRLCAEQPDTSRPSLWCLCELPFDNLPSQFLADVRRSGVLCVAEEHVAQGSAGAMLAMTLMKRGSSPTAFIHKTALGYPSGTYGSQKFHRQECGLDAGSILLAAMAGSSGGVLR